MGQYWRYSERIVTTILTECRPAHLRAIRDRLRTDDAREVACTGMTAGAALWSSYRASILLRAAIVDGVVAAVWGCGGSAMGHKGNPWLLTAPEIERVPVAMVREGRREVAAMAAIFPRLENFVAADYSRACRFLELLGFELDAAVPIGLNGALFRRFWMER